MSQSIGLLNHEKKVHSIQKYGTFCYLIHLPNYLNYNIHFKVHEKMCQIGQIWHISLKFKLLWLQTQIFYFSCEPKVIIMLKIGIMLENWWFDNKKLGKICLCKNPAPSNLDNAVFWNLTFGCLNRKFKPTFW